MSPWLRTKGYEMFSFLRPKDTHDVISVEQAGAALESGDAIFIDVREVPEWARGHLPGAWHLPLSRIEHDLKSLPKDKPLVVYCLSGARSSRAASILRHHGIADVKNLRGGIAAWQRHGLPLN